MKEDHHSRAQFQIDRIAFFSDAIIAIAITLAVLEIKIPEMGQNITFSQFWQRYAGDTIGHVLALVIGFMTIGQLWMRHHELFEHIVRYHRRLAKINLYFLFSVSLLPISISFLFAKNEPPLFQRSCYFVNLLLINFLFHSMLLLIFNKKYNLSGLTNKMEIRLIKTLSLTDVLTLLAVVVISIIDNHFWFLTPFLVGAIARRLIKRSAKKHKVTLALD